MLKSREAESPIPKRVLLAELPDDNLGSIATFAGPCALSVMFGIGNRLLTEKLLSSTAIPYYSNINEYGNPILFSLSFLKRLRGLKSVVLDLSEFPSPRDYSLVSILSALPDGIQEIDISNIPRLLSSVDKKATDPIPVETALTRSELRSRFPLLRKFRCVPAEWTRWIWGPNILTALPPTLTDLFLGAFFCLHKPATRFPEYLQSLTLIGGRLVGLSWILKDLPNLTSLTVSNVTTWELEEEDFSAEMAVMRHRNMKHLACSALFVALSIKIPIDSSLRPQKVEGYLLDHFPLLEDLDIPNLRWWDKFENFPKLKSCSTDADKIRGTFPSSLTILKLKSHYISRPLHFPRHLTTLEVHLRLEDLSILPRSLTELWSSHDIDSSPGWMTKLPPHLKILVFAPTRNPLEWRLPASLQYIYDSKKLYAKTPNLNLSLDQSGYTSLLQAARTGDFEGLDAVLHFLPRLQKAPFRAADWKHVLFDDPEVALSIHTDCYDWLWKRGLLAKHSLVGCLSKDFCWSAIWQDRPKLLKRWSKKFTERSWKIFGSAILESIADDHNGLWILERIHPTQIPIDPRIGKSALTAAFLQHNDVIASKLADLGYQIDLRPVINCVFRCKKPNEYNCIHLLDRKTASMSTAQPRFLVHPNRSWVTEQIITFLRKHFLNQIEGETKYPLRMVDRNVPISSDTLTKLISDLWVPGDLSKEIFDLLDLFHDAIGLDLNVLFQKLVPIRGGPVSEARLLEAIEWMAQRNVSMKSSLEFTHHYKCYRASNIAQYAAVLHLRSVLRYLNEPDPDFEELPGVQKTSVLGQFAHHLRITISKVFNRYVKEPSRRLSPSSVK